MRQNKALCNKAMTPQALHTLLHGAIMYHMALFGLPLQGWHQNNVARNLGPQSKSFSTQKIGVVETARAISCDIITRQIPQDLICYGSRYSRLGVCHRWPLQGVQHVTEHWGRGARLPPAAPSLQRRRTKNKPTARPRRDAPNFAQERPKATESRWMMAVTSMS